MPQRSRGRCLRCHCLLSVAGSIIRANPQAAEGAAMARPSKEQTLAKLHQDALAQFNDIQTALRDERLQCLQDRRSDFCIVIF